LQYRRAQYSLAVPVQNLRLLAIGGNKQDDRALAR
jgi:hypothetical protein